jgi:hypothetical protein
MTTAITPSAIATSDVRQPRLRCRGFGSRNENPPRVGLANALAKSTQPTVRSIHARRNNRLTNGTGLGAYGVGTRALRESRGGSPEVGLLQAEYVRSTGRETLRRHLLQRRPGTTVDHDFDRPA